MEGLTSSEVLYVVLGMVSAIGVIFGILGYSRSKGRDSRDDSKEAAELASDISEIKTATVFNKELLSEIKADLRALQDRMDSQRESILAVNETAKKALLVAEQAQRRAEAAHERLDVINAPNAAISRNTKKEEQQ